MNKLTKWGTYNISLVFYCVAYGCFIKCLVSTLPHQCEYRGRYWCEQWCDEKVENWSVLTKSMRSLNLFSYSLSVSHICAHVVLHVCVCSHARLRVVHFIRWLFSAYPLHPVSWHPYCDEPCTLNYPLTTHYPHPHSLMQKTRSIPSK